MTLRFDVCRNRAGPRPPYFLVVQSEQLDVLSTRVIVPLSPMAGFGTPITRIHPIFEIAGEPHVMVTNEIAGIHKRMIGEVVASLANRDTEIVDAIDFLLQGY